MLKWWCPFGIFFAPSLPRCLGPSKRASSSVHWLHRIRLCDTPIHIRPLCLGGGPGGYAWWTFLYTEKHSFSTRAYPPWAGGRAGGLIEQALGVHWCIRLDFVIIGSHNWCHVRCPWNTLGSSPEVRSGC